jgi:hypothetical protein
MVEKSLHALAVLPLGKVTRCKLERRYVVSCSNSGLRCKEKNHCWNLNFDGPDKVEASTIINLYEGRRPLGRPRRRWEDNIKMDLREIGFGNVDWIHWAQDRDRWRALVNLRVP